MVDKRMTEDEVVAELKDGMTIGIGGWGSRRKPMSLVRAILRSGLKDLTVVAYGGPDIGLLCAAGRLRRAVYGFVSLDSIPLEPHFRQARQSGAIEFTELEQRESLRVPQGIPAQHTEIPSSVVFEGVLNVPMPLNHHVARRWMP